MVEQHGWECTKTTQRLWCNNKIVSLLQLQREYGETTQTTNRLWWNNMHGCRFELEFQRLCRTMSRTSQLAIMVKQHGCGFTRISEIVVQNNVVVRLVRRACIELHRDYGGTT